MMSSQQADPLFLAHWAFQEIASPTSPGQEGAQGTTQPISAALAASLLPVVCLPLSGPWTCGISSLWHQSSLLRLMGEAISVHDAPVPVTGRQRPLGQIFIQRKFLPTAVAPRFTVLKNTLFSSSPTSGISGFSGQSLPWT